MRLHSLLWLAAVALLLSRSPRLPAAEEAGGGFRAGYGEQDITPPAGTPSAGYGARLGVGMRGGHDPLLATALVLVTPASTLVLVGVDSLGFDRSMVEEIRARARRLPGLEKAEIHLGSSHTHAGGGAFLSYPAATILFGVYDPERRERYLQGTVEAIRRAVEALQPARLGVGYRKVEGLNRYRGKWPRKVPVNPWLSLLKVARADGRPLAALFVFAAHPTVLGAENLEFSADFVGYARRAASSRLEGAGVVYFNGAQGDVSPVPPREGDKKREGDKEHGEDKQRADGRFAACERMGARLGEELALLWQETETVEAPRIDSRTVAFTRAMRPGSSGYTIALEDHATEMSAIAIEAIAIEGRHVFLTVPGELSTIYDARLRDWAVWMGFRHATVLGLTDDAIGYIVTPESYRHRSYESTLSFSGPDLGPFVEEKAVDLLHLLEPEGKPAAAGGPARPAQEAR